MFFRQGSRLGHGLLLRQVALHAVFAVVAVAAPLTLDVLVPEQLPATWTHERIHIAARTAPGSTATIGGVPCEVYSSGVFVRDGVPLTPGANQIRIAVTAAGGGTTERVLDIRRDPPPPTKSPLHTPIVIDADSVRPDKDLACLPGDELEIAFHGSPGRVAEWRYAAGGWQHMTEDVDRKSGLPTGYYRATVVLTHNGEGPPVPLEVRLAPEHLGEKGASEVHVFAKGKVAFWSPAIVRQAVVTRDIGSELVWGLHDVRLGGPAVGRMPQNTILRVTGQRGKSWRVRLTPQLEAWADGEHVKLLPPGQSVPRLTFTTLQVKADRAGDRLEIPWNQHIPFATTATVAPSGRPAIDVDLYGAQHACTWISHHQDLTVIREVTVDQLATDHVRVRVELAGPRLWGYKMEAQGNALVLTVRPVPKLAPQPASPLSGLTIAVEAGHGGSNQGASGLCKVFEKDITLGIADGVAEELTRAGARVFRVRKREEFISMEDRAKRALDSDAQLFVSVHCNSSDTDAGFLKVGGTSTYYKHPMARDLARALIGSVIAQTQLSDFGSVGNFNYYPIRALTWMPAALVETAFLSNPAEEAKLLDPAFRQTMAQAVRKGIEDFLKQVAAEH